MDWLLVIAPLLAEIRNVKKLAGRSPTCVYIPARGREQPLSHTSRYAVVVRDADDECAEDNCIKVPTTGKSAAVEYIVNNANCEYVAIFDSDVYFTPTDAERLAAAAGRDGVATSYRLVVGRGFWGWVAAAASDFGFVMMALYRFVWGGAVAGRKETLARVMRGVSNAVSDDMYATARAKALGVPIRFIYLRLISPPPADSPRTVFKWIQRQYAMAARLGPPAVKVGLAALAIWLATWVLYPHTLLIYAVAGYIRRKALGVPATLLYIPAAAVAYVYTLAAVVLGFLTREVEWRGRVMKLNATPPPPERPQPGVRPSREAQARGFKISSYLRNADSSTTSNPNSPSKALIAIHGPPTAPPAQRIRVSRTCQREEVGDAAHAEGRRARCADRYQRRLRAERGRVGGYVSLNTELSAEPQR